MPPGRPPPHRADGDWTPAASPGRPGPRARLCFSRKRRHTKSVSAFLLNRSSDLLNMLGTFVKDWFRYESHFVHGRDSLVDILKERGLPSESDAVQPLIGKKS